MSSRRTPRTFSGSRPRLLAGRSFSRRRAAKDPENAQVVAFRVLVWKYWRENGRHDLPWRKTKDPYRILVSEIMLQQTQVPRVLGKYKEFLKQFPTVRALAKASLSDVLKVWSGLGYNRRGKHLQDAAKEIVEKYDRNLKRALEHKLSGVGPYTRAAVKAFAFNESGTFIETNIRAAYIHHFFGISTNVHDREILLILKKAAEGQDPRKWHWALMDYGAHLKRSGVHNNHKSAHYTKQSKFEGSLRQVRGAILRKLQKGSRTENAMRSDLIAFGKRRLEKALAGLARDGLIAKEKGKWRIT